jgi:hypothetical protein
MKNNDDRGRMVRLDMVRKGKERPCRDCGGSFPHYVMQYDHVRGVKLSDLSSAWRSMGRLRLAEEIAKCEVVCANCHAIRTFQRGDHLKHRPRVSQLVLGVSATVVV